MHLRDITEPSVDYVPDGGGSEVKVLRVGVERTEKEFNPSEYWAASAVDDFLVTGHESFGVMVELASPS